MERQEIDMQQSDEQRDEEYARRVLREVQYIQSEPKQTQQQEQSESEGETNETAATKDEQQRRPSIGWLLLSGNILLLRDLSKHYGKMVMVAALFLLSIIVMFWSLHLDMKYNDMMVDIQLLRERSVRLQEQRFTTTSHSAIKEEMERRGMELIDPKSPATLIEGHR